MPQTRYPPNVVTGVSRPESTQPFVTVPNLTISNQPSLHNTSYSIQQNQPQRKLKKFWSCVIDSSTDSHLETNLKFYQASQSCFAEPVKRRSSVPNIAKSQSAPQGLSGAQNMKSGNSSTVPQVVPVTSGGTIYNSNTSSWPNLVGGAVPNNVSFKAPMTVGGTLVVSAESIAREPSNLTVQILSQLLASSRKDHLSEWQLAQYNGDIL